MIERQWIKSDVLAKRLGVKTNTLAKWRRVGKGPPGYRHLSPTCVIYPIDDVERWLLAKTAAA